jgi:galactonate dehydratase
MKITAIDTFRVPPRWLFVKVTTDEGVVGWGEATLEGWAESVEGAFAALRDRFVGTAAGNIEDVWQVAHRGGFYRGGPVLMSATAGLEHALWDIKGRALGVPVWELLGGRVRDRVRVYGWVGGDRPENVAEAARAMRERGFDAVKMNATSELGYLGNHRDVDAVAERVAAVRSVGLDVAVDFHGRVHRAMAKQLLDALEPLRPLFVEEVVLSEHREALANVARGTTIPIALGERLYGRWDVKPFLHEGHVDILQPDVVHAGGILETRKIAAMAEAYDVAIAPHCPIGPIALAASLQLAACTPNLVIQEMSLGIHYDVDANLHTYLRDAAVLTPRDGVLPIPTGPGLGIELDEDAITEASKGPHRWRNPIWRLSDGSLAEW